MRWLGKVLTTCGIISASSLLTTAQTSWLSPPAIPWRGTFDSAHVKLHVKPEANHGLFRAKDTIVIQASGGGPIHVFDLRGHVVFDGNKSCKLHLPTGHYFVEADGDRTEFAVLPNDYRGASFLGVEADEGGNFAHTERVEQIAPGIVRAGGGLLWNRVQPQRNAWDWTQADQIMRLNASRNRRLLVPAFLRPDWLTRDEEFIPEFTRFVRALARRYAGRLYAIEIWNEPWTSYDLGARLPNFDAPNQPMKDGDQMVRSYIRVLAEARRVIKQVDPRILVAGPGWVNADSYYDVTHSFAEAGGTGLLDLFSYHDYDGRLVPPDVQTSYHFGIVHRLDQKVQIFQERLGQPRVPIFVDEIGLYGRSALQVPNSGDPVFNSNLSWWQGTCRAMKYAFMYRAAGVQALIPHVLALSTTNSNANLEIYGWEFDFRGPHPKTSAFLMSCYWLNGSTLLGSRTIADKIFVYGWRQRDGTLLGIVWTTEGTTAKLRDAAGMRTTDIFGTARPVSQIGEEPVLVHPPSRVSGDSLVEYLCGQVVAD